MDDILDLDQFALHRPESDACRALVARSRHDLARTGMFNLDGFLKPAAAARTVDQLAARFDAEAFEHARDHNIYFTDQIPDLADDHPAHRKLLTSNHTLCADQAQDTVLERLYEWRPLHHFLARVLDLPELFPMADPLAKWNVMRYGPGQGLNWHFDRSEFTTTLLLQAPGSGGVFEYRPNLRSESDPNYDGVGALLRGQDRQVKQVTLAPGTLNVFRGRNTAHRVTPVQRTPHRMIAVFTYYQTPGMRFSDEENTGFYGRAG